MDIERRLFAIDGLFCGGCARGLERKLSSVDGVLDAGVHFVTASALIQWDPSRCDTATLARQVAAAGYGLLERNDPASALKRFDDEVRRLSRRLAIAILFGMWSMAGALLLYAEPDLDAETAWWAALFSGLFATPVLCYSGAGFWRMALRSIRLRSPGLDLLVCIGAAGAALLSLASLARGGSAIFFDTATMLITLLLVGRLIETRVRRGAIAALEAVGDLATTKALPAGGGEAVPYTSIAPGDAIWVDAGSTIPIDGVVTHGETLIDRAILTGESAPIAAKPGDRVQAGTINLRRRMTIIVDRAPGDSDLDRMGGRIAIEMAGRGEPKRHLDAVVDRLAIIVPILAAVVGAVTLAMTGSPLVAAERALAVLVVVCPCSLALAAPLVHVRAAALAGGLGFRIADPAAFEALGRARSVIFDKTGTLTMGEPEVIAIDPVSGWTADAVLDLAARAENGIDHPIARAILAAAGPVVSQSGERAARSATGRDEYGATVEVRAADPSPLAGTRLAVVHANTKIGTITLDDIIDPQAAPAIVRLISLGLDPFVATGDALAPAIAVGAALGLPASKIHAACTPEDKVALVKAVSRPVIMVGDGVNDAPALAGADCGVAVGRAHGAATATAGIVLVEGGIKALPFAIALSRQAIGRVRQNWVLALSYNAIVLPAAAAGALTPLLAVIAMMVNSAVVTANGMRLSSASLRSLLASQNDTA